MIDTETPIERFNRLTKVGTEVIYKIKCQPNHKGRTLTPARLIDGKAVVFISGLGAPAPIDKVYFSNH